MVRGKRVMLGAIDVANDAVETAEEVAQTLHNALEYVNADRLIASTNCGMAPFRRDVALAKLSALGAGDGILCEELVSARVKSDGIFDAFVARRLFQSNLPRAP